MSLTEIPLSLQGRGGGGSWKNNSDVININI